MTAEMEVDDSSRPNIVINLKRKLSSLVEIEVEPVGKWYYHYELARLKTNHTLATESEDEETSDEQEEDTAGDDEVEIEDDIVYLRSLNPADWKNQDHYTVLGLGKYRYKASDEHIKKAYRMMVLRHHPDKRGPATMSQGARLEDDYFTCITRAYEVLGVPVKRRAFDSVDPDFDNDIPSLSDIRKGDFFEVFAPVIERNARWSIRKHVPLLGKPDDSKQKVDKFYNFWMDFDSWREFSYLDEEEKEKGQDREERRWIEKQNKAERALRRKEEMGRLRKLINMCYDADPRVAKFREEEKERRLAIKKARQDAIRQRMEEEEKVRREAEDRERAELEAAQAEERAKAEAEKRARENVKKALKKERKILRTTCRDAEYFAGPEEGAERVQAMTDVELLCEALDATRLRSLNERLAAAAAAPPGGAKGIFMEQVSEVKAQIEREKEEARRAFERRSSASIGGAGAAGSKAWTSDDIQMLIKAVNLFPAGTSKRWEVVAEYLNQHATASKTRTAKEVLGKAKELQGSEHQMKEAAKKINLQAKDPPQSSLTEMNPSVRLDTPQEMLGMNLRSWTADEQRLLEQALKSFPTSAPDRWERIAECIPDRSKKECMKRYKELVEMVKAKKAAQTAAHKK